MAALTGVCSCRILRLWVFRGFPPVRSPVLKLFSAGCAAQAPDASLNTSIRLRLDTYLILYPPSAFAASAEVDALPGRARFARDE